MTRQQKNNPGEETALVAEPTEPRLSLLERVAAFLDEDDWSYETNSEEGYLEMRISIHDAVVRVILDTYESDAWERLMMFVFLPAFVPENRRSAVLNAINRINYQATVGNFEMDLDDGELRIRAVFEAEGNMPPAMFERALYTGLGMANRFFAPLMAISFGKVSPESVLDLATRTDGESIQ